MTTPVQSTLCLVTVFDDAVPQASQQYKEVSGDGISALGVVVRTLEVERQLPPRSSDAVSALEAAGFEPLTSHVRAADQLLTMIIRYPRIGAPRVVVRLREGHGSVALSYPAITRELAGR